MNSAAIFRMSPLARTLPARILVADDDEFVLQLITSRLQTLGFSVRCAHDGREALQILEKEWYPLVITDLQMPVMDGIELTENLRSRGADDTYIIMLTISHDCCDYQRGYASGVDDYLTKKVAQSELTARVHAGFNTLAMRRHLAHTQAMLDISQTLDAETGAHNAGEIWLRLHSEVRRAQLHDRPLGVIAVGIEVEHAPEALPEAATLRGLIHIIKHSTRSDVDSIGRLDSPRGASFVIVLPECGAEGVMIVKRRLMRVLHHFAANEPGPRVRITLGAAALDESQGAIDATSLLQLAERSRTEHGLSGPAALERRARHPSH